MKVRNITTQKLKESLEKGNVLLLDVLPPEYYAAEHIKGALNAPVYEVTFLDYAAKIVKDKQNRIVVYNDRIESISAQDASEKLVEAGYEKVEIFQGGLGKWKSAGLEIEKGKIVVEPTIQDGAYVLDIEKSLVGWTGRNFKYAHHGKITAKSGSFVFREGALKSGEVVLDMKTIHDEDLTDEMSRGVLEKHLKSGDFFAVEKYPEALLKINAAVQIKGVLAGVPNYQITADLMIKDVTREISFASIVVPMGDGVVNWQAHFDFDRTLWNVRYGSEKFFEKLGMHLVNDFVSLEIFLVAKINS